MNLIKSKISLSLVFILLASLITFNFKIKSLRELNSLLELTNRDLTYQKSNLENLVLTLEANYQKNLEKLKEFESQKSLLNKELQEVKNSFKEQENEELNDNLLDSINFVSSRMCQKTN